jgi:hypothetical protein
LSTFVSIQHFCIVQIREREPMISLCSWVLIHFTYCCSNTKIDFFLTQCVISLLTRIISADMFESYFGEDISVFGGKNAGRFYHFVTNIYICTVLRVNVLLHIFLWKLFKVGLVHRAVWFV